MFSRLLLSAFLLAGLPPGRTPVAAQTYQDPRGRYTLSLPNGWAASGSGDKTVFRNGSGWVMVRLLTATHASDAVDQAVALFRPQFVSFSTINRGDTTIAGRSSHGLNIDAMTASGERVSVLFTAQPAGQHQFFVLVSSTPLAQAPLLNASIMTLAGSVHFAE